MVCATPDISAIEPEQCACGRIFRRIRDISTKAKDIVVLPDGRWISPSILTHPFKSYPQIVKSQVVQETLNEVVVRVVAGQAFSAEMSDGLRAGLEERLGPAVRVRIEMVDDISREASGKYRWVISRVPHELRVRWMS
jgi:phenylacetate-CoA ligase